MLRSRPRPLGRLEGFLHRFQLFNVKMKPLSLFYFMLSQWCGVDLTCMQPMVLAHVRGGF
jgi:hypothetical protein